MEDRSMADMITLTIDPEFQALIPPLQEDEQAQLEANLLEEGCREALVVRGGESPTDAAHSCPGPWVRQLPLESTSREVTWLCATCGEVRQRPYVLLDGHHRYTICQRHEMPFTIAEAPAWVKTHEEASIWIIQNQLGRRNLEPYARVELVLKLEPLMAAKSEERMKAGKAVDPGQNFAAGRTVDQVGKLAGVSSETARKAKVIANEADEPIKEALRRGERSIHRVFQKLRPPKPVPSSTVKGEGSTAHPPLVPPSAGIGPDASVDPHASAAPVTARLPGHETTESSVESPPQSDGPSAHQEELSTPAHRCLTLMGALYAELQTLADVHDLIAICEVRSQQARAEYLQQCTYLISTLQVIEQALHTTAADAQPLLGGVEGCPEADPTPDDGGARDEPTRDGRKGAPLAFEGPRVTATMALEARRKPEGDEGRSPSTNAEPTEPIDVSHAAVDPMVPMPTVGATASRQVACDETGRQALDERIMATFPAGAPPRGDEVATFVRRLNAEGFSPPYGARTWHMAAMWQRLRALGYPTSGRGRTRR
jgi:hypothetical protein